MLDLSNSMLEPPQFIGHFRTVLRALRFKEPVLNVLQINTQSIMGTTAAATGDITARSLIHWSAAGDGVQGLAPKFAFLLI